MELCEWATAKLMTAVSVERQLEFVTFFGWAPAQQQEPLQHTKLMVQSSLLNGRHLHHLAIMQGRTM